MSDGLESARLERINAIIQAVEFRCMKKREIHSRVNVAHFVRHEISASEMVEIIDLAKPR